MRFTRTLTLNYRVNMVGLTSSILLFYTALSNKAWWIVRGGIGDEYIFMVEASPFNIVVEVLGRPVTVPIIPYLCLAARLCILLAATAIFVGSLLAGKSWSKPMMGLSGLILPIIFTCILFTGLGLAKSYAGVSIPLSGEFTLSHVIPYHEFNIVAEIPAIASFTEEYWIALVAGVLSALARLIHSRTTHPRR